MNIISPTAYDDGLFFANSDSVTVRPAKQGDACNMRFRSYTDAVRYLVWNAMLGCRFASDDVARQRATLEKAERCSADRCAELAKAMRLMDEAP